MQKKSLLDCIYLIFVTNKNAAEFQENKFIEINLQLFCKYLKYKTVKYVLCKYNILSIYTIYFNLDSLYLEVLNIYIYC